MNYLFLTLILIINLLWNGCSSRIIEGRITKNSIDKVYLGMKISDLKKTLPNCDFSEIPLYEFGIDSENNGLLIKQQNNPILFVWTMQGDSKVVGMICLTEKFETKDNVKVGMTVKDLLRVYPNCSLSRDCLEMASEYYKLEDMNVIIEFVTNDSDRVGNYLTDDCNERTTMLDLNRKIDRILVSKMPFE